MPWGKYTHAHLQVGELSSPFASPFRLVICSNIASLSHIPYHKPPLRIAYTVQEQDSKPKGRSSPLPLAATTHSISPDMLSQRPKTRLAVLFLAAVTSFFICLFVVHQALLPILAWFIPALEVPFYDLAVYGAYPEQEYVSFDLPASQPNLVAWDDQCDSGNVFITLSGPSIAHPGPSILDARGGLVWTSEEFGTTLNMRQQNYKGEKYITFWAGQKAATMGQGEYYMLDSSYNVTRKFDAIGENLHGDLHEFKITDDDTVLLTVYTKKEADLTGLGHWRGKNGWIVDSMFQEIDLETNELLFEWSASDHFPPSETYYTDPFGGYSEASPFDSFHINSVDKEPSSGNYLVSSRHTHSISLIDGQSGEVLWRLGGMHNEFTDLSGGLATDFAWQHDARWLGLPSDANGEKGIYTISFFANGMAGPLHVDATHSNARIVRLDTNAMTAELLQSFSSYHSRILASSQGSVEIVPETGNVFVGWGASAAWSEFSPDGTLLCEAHVSASSTFILERAKSYRVFKTHSWVGKPSWPPSARLSNGKVFVSWNGATEIQNWELQAQKTEDEEWTPVDEIEKTGFEESFAVPKGEGWTSFRAVAYDKDKQILGTSEPAQSVPSGSWSMKLFVFAIVVSLVAALVWGVRTFLRKRRGYKAGLFAWDRNGSTNVRYSPL